MGMESYLLRLHGNRSDRKNIVEFAQSSLGLVQDIDQFYARTPPYSYYVSRDGRHVIEFEFREENDQIDLSVRFALCHPSSVGPIFLGLIESLMEQFDLTATICENLPENEPREYSRFDDRFAANCLWSISDAKSMWQRQFGPEEAGLSVSDALRRFVVKSVPVVSPSPDLQLT